MRIACLHTAQSNVAVLEAAAAALGVEGLRLTHKVRPDLLAAAQAAGEMTSSTRAETEVLLRELAVDSDAVLLTCSSIGRAVDGLQDAAVPVLRVDAALAERAVQHGGKVVVLCAAPSTVGPTTDLFGAAATASGATIETRVVPGAWALFGMGDSAGYLSLIADAVDQAYRDGADVVALAQVSMAGAAELVRGDLLPLTSPSIGLQAAIERIEARQGALVQP